MCVTSRGGEGCGCWPIHNVNADRETSLSESANGHDLSSYWQPRHLHQVPLLCSVFRSALLACHWLCVCSGICQSCHRVQSFLVRATSGHIHAHRVTLSTCHSDKRARMSLPWQVSALYRAAPAISSIPRNLFVGTQAYPIANSTRGTHGLGRRTRCGEDGLVLSYLLPDLQ